MLGAGADKVDYSELTGYGHSAWLYAYQSDMIEWMFAQSKDVPSTWAAEQVRQASDLKLIPDFLNNRYTQNITREEFCALAAVLYEKYKGEVTARKYFTDTDNVYVQKMAAVGVVTGQGDGRFNPLGTFDRESAAAILVNLAQALGEDLPVKETTFSDTNISTWARTQVGQVQAAGLMNGGSHNLFHPKTIFTRQDAILIILHMYEFMER